jgi:hypothetical protein
MFAVGDEVFSEAVHRLDVIAFLESGVAGLEHSPNRSSHHGFVERRRSREPRPHRRINRHINVLHQQLPLGGICYVGFDDPKLCRQRQSLRAFDQMHFSASHFCP